MTIEYFVKQAQKKASLDESKERGEPIISHVQQNIEDTFKKCVKKMESGDSDEFIRTRPAAPEPERKHESFEPLRTPEGPSERRENALTIVPTPIVIDEQIDDLAFDPEALPHLRELDS